MQEGEDEQGLGGDGGTKVELVGLRFVLSAWPAVTEWRSLCSQYEI